MNARITFLLMVTCCLLLSVSPGNAVEKSCDEMLKESEQLFLENKFDEVDAKLGAVMKKCPKLSEPYWRKGMNIYERYEKIPRDQKPSKEDLIKKYEELEAWADKGIEINENDSGCWHWKGAGIARKGTTKGVLNMLWAASKVEDAWLKAAELENPHRAHNGYYSGKADTYYAMGQYYRVVPEWLKYFPFKQIFSTHGDKKKSIEYQRKAVAIEPKRVEYHKELAISLICHGNSYNIPDEIEEGKKILINLNSLPTIKETDKIDKEHARMLLKDLSLACGYVRDKQQEVSEEEYEKANK